MRFMDEKPGTIFLCNGRFDDKCKSACVIVLTDHNNGVRLISLSKECHKWYFDTGFSRTLDYSNNFKKIEEET
jgi:hypothetical protein